MANEINFINLVMASWGSALGHKYHKTRQKDKFYTDASSSAVMQLMKN